MFPVAVTSEGNGPPYLACLLPQAFLIITVQARFCFLSRSALL